MGTIRIQNNSGYYHITARGNGKQIIFNDDDDFQHYLYLLKTYNNNLEIEIIAYCLMNNHIHLLIFDPKFNMGILIRNVHSLYTRFFNYKYERIGNLFQGRFNSKGINDEKQLFAALRYVLENPEEAGICKPKNYKWSSYKQYGQRSALVNTSKIDSLLGSYSEFEKLVNSKDTNNNYNHNDIDEDVLKRLLCKKFNLDISSETRTFSKKKRDTIILYLSSKGATYKQIVRLTGVSYGIVQRVICKNKNQSNKNQKISPGKSNADPGERVV